VKAGAGYDELVVEMVRRRIDALSCRHNSGGLLRRHVVLRRG
jgi:hypothetical protein